MVNATTILNQLVKRYQVLPKTLYRIQAKLPIRLRDYDTQMAKGRASYDLKLCPITKKVLPAEGDEWIGPNGASLRPATETMVGILKDWVGEPTIFRLNEGMRLPDDLVVIHERDDHYSMQTTIPVELDELNDKITKIMEEAPQQTREQFLEQYYDEDDQDN
ncbi:hypothetical protein ACA910_010809 [Epithemia clementina (nom. ined.)]